jgi:MoaA/NifB/PqqE/SkfB family radical SAM enzyme
MPVNKSDDANLNDVIKNLRTAKRLGVRFVDFTGGEPLLHDDLSEMLKEAGRLGFKTTITTNGLRYDQRAHELAGLVNFLHFSLDGLSAEKHNAIRGQSAFSHVMKSLDTARTMGETPDLLFTVNQNNIDHLEPMADFARRLGLMLIVNPVFAYSDFEESGFDVLDQVEQYSSTPFVYVNKAFHQLRRRGGNDVNKPRCRVMDSTIVLSPDNKVVLPCYHFQQEKLSIKNKVIASDSADAESRGNLHSKGNSFSERSRRHSVPRDDLSLVRNSSTWRHYHKNQGRFAFCQGCHLNCYFDPSFHYKIDEYFWLSSLAKAKYWWDKNVRRTVVNKKLDDRPAAEIAKEIMSRYDKH